MIGSRIGHFRILEELGAGAMGVVYRAYDEKMQRDVALKCLPRGVVASESSRRLMEREAVALSRINHPGIAGAHTLHTFDGVDFLEMEFVPGESLDRRIARGAIPEPELIALGIQFAEGLAEAHRRGVVHRDLKPGNLRVTPEGQLKILDLGLARWHNPESESFASVTDTESRGVVGTLPYIAPELLRGRPATARSDLYSAGLVMYEASTGSLPFPGMKPSELLEAILHRDPPSSRSRNPALSPSLEAVIRRCMEKNPAHRYAAAVEMAEDLRRIQQGKLVRLRNPLVRSLRPALAVALAAVVIVAAWEAWRRIHPSPNPQTASIRTLAVLPFGNLTGDPAQEYIAAGMTDELIAQLSNVDSLRVISLVHDRKPSRPLREIVGELEVDGMVEGSMLRSGNRLRFVVHVLAARDHEQLWSDQYDSDTTNLLKLQSKVAGAIVREIQGQLTAAGRARLKRLKHVDPVAYQLYMHGRYQWNKRSDEGIRLALDYFQSAIRQDSSYALFYSGLADAWAAEGLYGMIPPLQARDRARAAAAKAVALDPDLSEAHTSLAHVLHNFDWDWRGAEKEYLRAIEQNSNNAVAHHWLGHLYAQQGRFDEARQELALAEEIDPLSISIVMAGGVNEYYAGRYAVALEHLRRAAALDSSNALLHRATAGVLDRLGREREAASEIARSLELKGRPDAAAALRSAYAKSGLRGLLEMMIAALIAKRSSGAYEPAEHIAELYARLGRVEPAFEWLDVALREHDTELNRLRADPLFDPLRSDPRFDELLRRVGLASTSAPS